MALPIFQTSDKDLNMMQTKWASMLNPLLSNSANTPYVLQNTKLVTGDNIINHLQDKVLNGYIIVGMHGSYSQIYDKVSPTPKLTLILNSSADTTVDIMVF